VTTKTDVPAFPIPLSPGQSWNGMEPADGMTLRDYFAAAALNTAFQKAIHNFKCDGVEDLTIGWDHIAESAYELADEMLIERKRHEIR